MGEFWETIHKIIPTKQPDKTVHLFLIVVISQDYVKNKMIMDKALGCSFLLAKSHTCIQVNTCTCGERNCRVKQKSNIISTCLKREKKNHSSNTWRSTCTHKPWKQNLRISHLHAIKYKNLHKGKSIGKWEANKWNQNEQSKQLISKQINNQWWN